MKWKKEFEVFFELSPKYNGYRNSVSFQELFDWLYEPEQVFKMIQASEYSRPALDGIVNELESKFDNRSDLDISSQFVRQMIGRAIKDVLFDFGYSQTNAKPLASKNLKYFKQATCYKKDEDIVACKEVVLKPAIKVLAPYL